MTGPALKEPLLKRDAEGPVVRDLQESLKAHGFHPGPANGVFGAETESALKSFQGEEGIAADGVVGPETWRRLIFGEWRRPTLETGLAGIPVRYLQYRLGAFGYDIAIIDGNYDARTEAAVRKLQQDYRLTVDGVVGERTWETVDSLESCSGG